ncbi:MAG TPA: hypothetical protein VE988_08645 [Gemmataceae bacterium]|nr:hypothetical protein [Gemmataceae bacterium]
MAQKQITCSGYRLAINNNSDDDSVNLVLVAHGKDGNKSREFHLTTDLPHDQPELVQKILRRIADVWPSFAWSFLADGQTIVDTP